MSDDEETEKDAPAGIDRDDRTLAADGSGRTSGRDEAPVIRKTEPAKKSRKEIGEGPGDRVGPYELLQQIGEGGFGVVYLAEQTQPVRRRVALKIIKPGMDTKEVIARFEAERQALALMDHPGVAQVYDAGATERGRPFFVMELVEGVPVTDYCDNQHLDTRGRLELFREICVAVQHAHQKGVIHRDLKPSNILVIEAEGKPAVKVIDFGIAKSINQSLTEHTLFTAHGQLIGTPQYMSPEQSEINAMDVDTRSDIYSLGVLLYELLTGRTPFDPKALKQAALDEIIRIIREEEPPKPSTRLSTLTSEETTKLASAHGEKPGKLQRMVRGELDWIVMKAMEKDRRRRYETASEFAEDIRRFLADESVEAGPPARLFRMKKFVRRNKLAVVTGILLTMVLLVGLPVILLIAWGTRYSREYVEKSVREAEATHAFYRDNILAAANPESEKGGMGIDVTIYEALNAAEPKIAGAFPNLPLAEASVRATLADTFSDLGENRAEITQREREIELRRRAGEANDWETVRAKIALGEAHLNAGDRERGISLLEEVYEFRKRTLGLEHEKTRSLNRSLAGHYKRSDRSEDALELRTELVKVNRAIMERKAAENGPDDPETLTAMNNLAVSLGAIGRNDEAIRIHEETLKRRRSAFGNEHDHTFKSLRNLAASYAGASRYDEAIALREEILDLRRRTVGPGHQLTLDATVELASAYYFGGRKTKAQNLGKETLDAMRLVMGPNRSSFRSLEKRLYFLYRSGSGDPFRAGPPANFETVKRLELELESKKSKSGVDHPETLTLAHQLAKAYDDVGRKEEAGELMKTVLERRRQVLGSMHRDTFTSMADLAGWYGDEKRLDEGAALKEELLQLVIQSGGEHWRTPYLRKDLSHHYRSRGQFEQARKHEESILAAARNEIEGQRKELGEKDPRLIIKLITKKASEIAGTSDVFSFQQEALSFRELALELAQKNFGADSPESIEPMIALAESYWEAGEISDAAQLYQRGLEWFEKRAVTTENTEQVIEIGRKLAEYFRCSGDLDRAIHALEVVMRYSPAQPTNARYSPWPMAMGQLARLYEKADRRSEEIALRKKELDFKFANDEFVRYFIERPLIEALIAHGDYTDAFSLLEKSAQRLQRIDTLNSPFVDLQISHLTADCHEQAGNADKALQVRKTIIETRRDRWNQAITESGEQSADTLLVAASLVNDYLKVGEIEKAAEIRQQVKIAGSEAIRAWRNVKKTIDSESLGEINHFLQSFEHCELNKESLAIREELLGNVLQNSSIAELWLTRTIKLQKKLNLLTPDEAAEIEGFLHLLVDPYSHLITNWALSAQAALVGENILYRGHLGNAELVLLEAHRGLEQGVPAGQRELLGRSFNNLIALYESWEKPEKEAEWRAKRDAYQREQE